LTDQNYFKDSLNAGAIDRVTLVPRGLSDESISFGPIAWIAPQNAGERALCRRSLSGRRRHQDTVLSTPPRWSRAVVPVASASFAALVVAAVLCWVRSR
jgi:hypothetical protein